MEPQLIAMYLFDVRLGKAIGVTPMDLQANSWTRRQLLIYYIEDGMKLHYAIFNPTLIGLLNLSGLGRARGHGPGPPKVSLRVKPLINFR